MRVLEAPDERLVEQIYIDSRGSVDTQQNDAIVVGIDNPDVGRAGSLRSDRNKLRFSIE